MKDYQKEQIKIIRTIEQLHSIYVNHIPFQLPDNSANDLLDLAEIIIELAEELK